MVPGSGGGRVIVSGARVWEKEGHCQWCQGLGEGGSVSVVSGSGGGRVSVSGARVWGREGQWCQGLDE